MNSSKFPEHFADVRRHVDFLRRHEGLACVIEKILGYPEIRKAFELAAGCENPFEEVARLFDLSIEIEGLEERVPDSGPVVFVANHGHGGADALALMAAMCRCRNDVRVLANREVGLLGNLGEYAFPVSLLNEKNASGNVASLRAMLKHVRKGGCLGVFPAGRVAVWKNDRMTDPPWNDHVMALLQKMKATIVPVWFFGSPPPAINLLSCFSPLIRTALIPTGLTWMRHGTIRARVGIPFTSDILKEEGKAAGGWMRANLQSLGELGN